MANWSCLPHDLLIFTVEHLRKLEDFAAFGAVCRSWRAAARKEHFKGLWLRQKTPYLMLPVRNWNDDIRELYCLADGEIVASVRFPNFRRKKCYESLGWLLAVEDDGSLSLLNPFTGFEIQLPDRSTFPGRYWAHEPYTFVRKMVLTARPNETSDFIVMMIISSDLAFWRLGDETWTILHTSGGVFTDITYQDGKFYTIDAFGYVKAYDIAESNPSEGNIIALVKALAPFRNTYVLKTSGSILVIERKISYRVDRKSKFEVYEVDILSGTRRMINSLGNIAIFVGYNATTAVDASTFPGFIKPNHIYFTNDECGSYQACGQRLCGNHMGAYNMETRIIEPFYHGLGEVEDVCSWRSPTAWCCWITPCF